MVTQNVERELPLQVLGKRHYEILKAVTDRIVPQVRDNHGMDIAQKIDSTLANIPKQYGEDLKFLLLVFEYGVPIFGGIFKWFTQMTPEDQDRYLEKWEKSKLPFQRMGFQALKRSALAAFYGSDVSWQAIGYRGPWLTKGFPYDYEGKGIQVPD